MQERAFRRFGHMLLLLAAIAVGIAGLVSTLSPMGPSVALASVVMDNDNDDGDNDNDDDANRILEGTVVSIDRTKNPPEMVLANLDGNVLVKMFKTDEFDITGVKVGDYVSVDGEKINTFLFESNKIEVLDRR